MRILLTDDQSPLGRAIADALRSDHELRMLPDARDRVATAEALAGCDAAIQIALPPIEVDASSDALDRATRGTYNLLTALEPPAALPRLILVRSLRPFVRYPAAWAVDEQWAPRPTSDAADLVPYLTELTLREVCRVRRTMGIVLRLGEVVDDAEIAARPVDTRWLHIDDAVQAVQQALTLPLAIDDTPGARWRLFHIVDGGAGARFPQTAAAREELGYHPRHQVAGPGPVSEVPPAPETPLLTTGDGSTQPRRVVIFGAGGPLGAIAAEALAPDHLLRLTDVRPLADIATAPPQSPGAPLPRPFDPPHENRVVDVTDPDQVMGAVEGMDVVLNLTVMRRDPVEAFRVNLLGARHIMQAAVAHGLRRVVQTGPIQTILAHPAGYGADFHLAPDAPARPGDDLYFLSKFLGQEVCRLFAEEYGIEVPCLLFGNFVDPGTPPPPGYVFYPFTLSWADAGTALRQGVRGPALPRPFAVMHPNADLPHGQYPNDEAKRLLDWQPRDRLEAFWRRPEERA